jgi:predicted nuclease of predicted toxin-antitoxin system
VKFILDANLSPRLSIELNAASCDTQHVSELGLLQASDIEIIDFAKKHRAVVITADVDFGTLLMTHRLRKPSIITVRQVDRLNVAELFELLMAAIKTNRSLLHRGGIIVVEPGSIRRRTLPLTDNTKD